MIKILGFSGVFLLMAITSVMAEVNLVEYPQGNYTWNKLCNGDLQNHVDQDSADVPYPNYRNAEIKKAVKILNYISVAQNPDSDTFWLYSDIEKVYGLCGGSKKKRGDCEKITADGMIIQQNTHNFLTILCGEFRDNVPMLKAKLRWVQNINLVQKGKQTYNKKLGVWEQITGEGYRKLVRLSTRLYSLRLQKLNDSSSDLTLSQKSVPAITTCEYRYILKEYLSTEKRIGYGEEDLVEYEKGLKQFWKTPRACKWGEKSYYNEFRGDGNFKPQSLESNAFIWNTRVFSKACKDTKTARPSSIITNKQCENYFRKPFTSRYNLAKEGLYRLFFYPPKYNVIMENYADDLVLMTEDLNKDGVADMIVLDVEKKSGQIVFSLREKISELRVDRQYGLAGSYSKLMHFVTLKAALLSNKIDTDYRKILEIAYKSSLKNILKMKKTWEKRYKKTKNEKITDDIQLVNIIIQMKDFSGISIITETYNELQKSIGKADKGFYSMFPEKEDAWKRLATILDRHTDWYMIDMLYLGYGFYQPTYSPWVASSYYINKSDVFTKPGYSMGLEGDGHRHWMFIQKVKKKKWFKASDMNRKWKENRFDLLNTWFDETTFSESHLGADEQGWDRFGSASKDEFGANLWLYEI